MSNNTHSQLVLISQHPPTPVQHTTTTMGGLLAHLSLLIPHYLSNTKSLPAYISLYLIQSNSIITSSVINTYILTQFITIQITMVFHSPSHISSHLLIIIVTLSIGCSDCRHFPAGELSKATAEAPASTFLPHFLWYNISASASAPGQFKKKELSYTTSHRETPGGPNPLHN